MPITHDNWEHFYQGAFAEHHISSLFYFYGFEVHKVAPDIGIDLLITNAARVRFKDAHPLSAEIQVKSALCDQTGAFVSMDANEIDFLCKGEQRYCVFVLLSKLRGNFDPGSFERGDDPDASMAVDRDLAKMWEARVSVEGRALRRRGQLSIYDFTEADLTLFWLHSSQMRRLRDKHLLKEMHDGRFGFEVTIDDSRAIICGITLISELHDLYYIVGTCRAGNRIRQGHLSLDDY
jgi:hypothetical protein